MLWPNMVRVEEAQDRPDGSQNRVNVRSTYRAPHSGGWHCARTSNSAARLAWVLTCPRYRSRRIRSWHRWPAGVASLQRNFQGGRVFIAISALPGSNRHTARQVPPRRCRSLWHCLQLKGLTAVSRSSAVVGGSDQISPTTGTYYRTSYWQFFPCSFLSLAADWHQLPGGMETRTIHSAWRGCCFLTHHG